MAGRSSITALKQMIDLVRKSTGFEKNLSAVKIISGGEGRIQCEMEVLEEHQNMNGTLHGGLTSTLVDSVSTWALLTTPEPVPGVSVDLSVTFLKAAPVGSTIVIDARTLKRGKRLAFLEVDVTDKSTGAVLATGKHTKYVG